MSLLQIRRNFQVTLPAKLRRILGIKEGDLIEAELVDNEAIMLKPKLAIKKGRIFSKKEIEGWIKEDELDKQTLKMVKKLAGTK